MKKTFQQVNKPVRKKDAMNLLLGKPAYVDDVTPTDCLVVKVLRSPHAHALIVDIDIETAKQVMGLKLFILIMMFLKNVLLWLDKHIQNQVPMIV